jgi:sec-independent protein translocase protein TatA
MGSMSLVHWLVVLVIAVLLFGNRLPTIGKSLGEGIKNFKDGLNGNEKDKQNSQNTPNGTNSNNDNTKNQG